MNSSEKVPYYSGKRPCVQGKGKGGQNTDTVFLALRLGGSFLPLKKDGEALREASDEMKGNREIVMTAVSNYGLALRFATKELWGDAEMLEAAFANNHGHRLVALSVSLLLSPPSPGDGLHLPC